MTETHPVRLAQAFGMSASPEADEAETLGYTHGRRGTPPRYTPDGSADAVESAYTTGYTEGAAERTRFRTVAPQPQPAAERE